MTKLSHTGLHKITEPEGTAYFPPSLPVLTGEQQRLAVETFTAALMNPGYRYEVYATGHQVNVSEMRRAKKQAA